MRRRPSRLRLRIKWLWIGSGSGSGGSGPSDSGVTITSEPKNVAVTFGQPATFSVKATGTAPLSYQWMQNGVDISDATDSTYTTPATVGTDNDYKFTVSVKNSVDSVVSKPAALTVTTPTIGGPSHAVFSQSAPLDSLGGSNPQAVLANFSSPVAAGFILACGIGTSDAVSAINSSTFTDSDDDTFYVTATAVIPPAQGQAYSAWCVQAPTVGGKNFSVQAATNQLAALGPPVALSYSGSSGYILQQTETSGMVPETGQTLIDSGSLVPTSSGQLAVGVAFVLDMFTAAGNGWTSRLAEENMVLEDAYTGSGTETAEFYSTYAINPYSTTPYVTFLFLIQ